MATASGQVVGPRTSIREAFRIQRRVIGALIMRELHTRYGRENIGYLWLVLEPLLLASIIGLIHARGGAVHSGDIKPVPLSVLGYCNFMTFRAIFNRGEGAIEQNLPLMYHKTVKILDILIARAVLEIAGTWVAFAILMTVAVAVGFANLPERPIFVILGMFAIAWFAFAGSLIIAGLSYGRKAVARLVHPFTYVMMPLSGAFFTLQALPGPLRDAFEWIPLAHIFETLRYGWFRAAVPYYISPGYLLAWLLGMTLLGLLLISLVRKRILMP